MPIPAPLTRLYRRLHPEWRMERANAGRLDANLDRLIAADPDAARIFDRGDFTRCHDDMAGFGAQFSERLQEYCRAKLAAGRMDLYHDGLFGGGEICPGCQHPRTDHDGDECLHSTCRCPIDLGNENQK
jgi:hypothetical protein